MQNLQPIEVHLQQLVESQPHAFPNMAGSYWDRYVGLTTYLRQNIYNNINAGLACLSKSPGIYTDHGGSHFDEVVRYAGILTGPWERGLLTPYEFYLLLCAIRVHDAGNIDGRDEHERRVDTILQEVGGNICADAAEFDLICKIAEAHGGRTDSNDKDTIGQLPETTDVACIPCRPRQVAALVRFADEISEHSGRSSFHHINADTLPEQNKLFQYYASSIRGARPDRAAKAFHLTLNIKAQYLERKYKCPHPNVQDKYLFDEVVERIAKLESERIYCNQFLDPALQTDRLVIKACVTRRQTIDKASVEVQEPILDVEIPRRRGYPAPPLDWIDKELCGKKIAVKAKREKWL